MNKKNWPQYFLWLGVSLGLHAVLLSFSAFQSDLKLLPELPLPTFGLRLNIMSPPEEKLADKIQIQSSAVKKERPAQQNKAIKSPQPQSTSSATVSSHLLAQIRQFLIEHKTYPAPARARRQEGIVEVDVIYENQKFQVKLLRTSASSHLNQAAKKLFEQLEAWLNNQAFSAEDLNSVEKFHSNWKVVYGLKSSSLLNDLESI